MTDETLVVLGLDCDDSSVLEDCWVFGVVSREDVAIVDAAIVGCDSDEGSVVEEAFTDVEYDSDEECVVTENCVVKCGSETVTLSEEFCVVFALVCVECSVLIDSCISDRVSAVDNVVADACLPFGVGEENSVVDKPSVVRG